MEPGYCHTKIHCCESNTKISSWQKLASQFFFHAFSSFFPIVMLLIDFRHSGTQGNYEPIVTIAQVVRRSSMFERAEITPNLMDCNMSLIIYTSYTVRKRAGRNQRQTKVMSICCRKTLRKISLQKAIFALALRAGNKHFNSSRREGKNYFFKWIFLSVFLQPMLMTLASHHSLLPHKRAVIFLSSQLVYYQQYDTL